ncbi:hypothetical protein XU19_24085, partial [Vibrio parahaemolyticus]
QLLRVHSHQDLTGGDEIALVDQDLLDPAGDLGRHVDLGRLDPPVAAGEPWREPRMAALLPRLVPTARTQQEEQQQDLPPSGIL